MPTPQIPLIDVSGNRAAINTLPRTGLASKEESLPVVLAQGVRPIQTFIAVPVFDGTNATTLNATCVLVVPDDPNRRYLKILNNSSVDIELWSTARPAADQVNRTIRRGEVLFAGGGGLAELGERISAIYATAATATELTVLVG